MPPAIATGLLLLYYAVGIKHLDGFALDLGSLGIPSPRHASFLLFYSVFGTALALCTSVALLQATGSGVRSFTVTKWWKNSSDRAWIAAASGAAFLIPALIRFSVLKGAAITDDESAYRFMAEVLAGGHLTAPSPPLKLFFDNVFMINDGRLYAQYFLGWPALMMPGVFAGATGYMNSVYAAATTPGIFLVLRRLAGSSWAKLGLLLYLSSPMLMMAAATEMSHTTCMMALVWTTYLVQRSRDEGSGPYLHAAVAMTFCLAFFIRPATAAGIGTPLLLWWLSGLRRLRGLDAVKALGAFALPTVAMAMLFLWVNYVQNGDPLVVSYQRAHSYAAENDYRFSTFARGVKYANFRFEDPLGALGKVGIGLLRLNFASFGWPLAIVFALCCRGVQGAWIGWAMTGSFLLVHFFALDSGVDTFGPAHYTELVWPLLIMVVLGSRRLAEAAPTPSLRLLPAALIAGFIIANLCAYAPVRLNTLAKIGTNVNLPYAAVREKGISNAVIFYLRPWVRQDSIAPTHHFVFWRPNNDPKLENDVLWVNHISLEADKELMKQFPGRSGYLQAWDRSANLWLLELDGLNPSNVPTVYPDWKD